MNQPASTAVPGFGVPRVVKRRRRKPSETSDAMWEKIKNDSAKNQQIYLWIESLLKRSGPLTDEEIKHEQEQDTNAPPSSLSGLRTRRNELTKKGVVRWNGDKRAMTTGNMAKVWELV